MYKSLLISDHTTVDELIQLLLNCYDSDERPSKFALYEVCPQRKCKFNFFIQILLFHLLLPLPPLLLLVLSLFIKAVIITLIFCYDSFTIFILFLFIIIKSLTTFSILTNYSLDFNL